MDYKTAILAKFSFGAALLCAATVQAQDLSASDDSESLTEGVKRLPNVTVTSERREGSLLDTPIAISAFDSETRDKLGVLEANDIANFTPGMTYQISPNRISIRGIGRLDNALGTDPGVATYIDGAYTPDALTLDRSPLFVERIEVLRGPQGTLFGRNAVGGLINIVSKRPVYEQETLTSLRVGKFENVEIALTNSGPIYGTESTAYRINVQGIVNGKGRYGNSFDGISELARDEEQYSLDLQLTHNFSDKISFWARYRTELIDGTAVPDRRPVSYDFRGPAAAPLVYLGALTPNALYGLDETNPSVSDPLTQRLDYAGQTRFDDVHELNWELEWDAGTFVIKYLGSDIQRSFEYSVDADGTARASHTLSATDPTMQSETETTTYHINEIGDDLTTASHELQFLSEQDGSVQWIAGIYHYVETSEQPFALNLPQAVAAGTPQIFNFTATSTECLFGAAPSYLCGLGGVAGEANPENNYYYQTGDLKTEAIAVYGQVDWEVASGMTAKVGLRYTEDKKKGTEEQSIYAYSPYGAYGAGTVASGPGTGTPTPIPWIQLTPNNNSRTLENKWDAWTGTVGLSQNFDDNGLAYVQYTRGYKAGGMRLGQLTVNNPVTAVDERFVDEEIVNAFEVGIKNQNSDGTAQFSGSVFYYDYKDQQAPINFVNAGGVTQQLIVNVPESGSFGIEFEAQWLPSDVVELGINYGYLNTEVESFSTLLVNAALTISESVQGNALPRSPQHSFTVYAGYTFEFDDLSNLTLLADWNHTDDLQNTLFDDPIYTIEANNFFNLRAIWNNHGGDWTVIGSVSNIFDDNIPDSVTVSTPELGLVQRQQYLTQRNFFIQLQKRF